MGLFSIELNSLEDLLLLQLEDLYDAEMRLTQALPRMADAASSPELQEAFRMHLQETEGHVRRLQQIFKDLNREPQRETCDAMKGLIAEGSDMISATGNPAVKDAALIAAAQRVEHYEMAGYGTVRTLARHLGREEIADLLQQTLDEEGNADKILTEIAENSVNAQATRAR